MFFIMPSPEIRVINIATRGPLHVPTAGDLESGIIESIKRDGIPLFRGEEFTAMQLASVRPHAPEGSTVLWITRQSKSGNPAPWTDASWDELSHSSSFLAKTERHVRELRRREPKKRVYFFIGFAAPQTTLDQSVYPHGLQSQRRGHLHVVNPIDKGTPYDRLLDGTREKDAALASWFTNQAGEISIAYFLNRLKAYGSRFEYNQPVGLSNTSRLPRTMFGFDNLEQALQSSLALQASVSADWIPHAKIVATTPADLTLFSQATEHPKQTAVPSIAIIFPTLEDRRNGETDNRQPVWSMPFSVTSAQSALSDGGVVFDYHKQESKP